MECTEVEKKSAEKRDQVKTVVDEINEKLAKIADGKKEKTKEAKKMLK